MNKTHQFENVTYRNAGRRWDFTAPNYSYTTTCLPGGRQTAEKAARIINGAIKRSGHMDNLARANMRDLFHRVAHPVSRVVNHTKA